MQKAKEALNAELKKQDCPWSLYVEESARKKAAESSDKQVTVCTLSYLTALWGQLSFCRI